MRTRSTARRSIALLATTALMTGGLATGMLASPAYAALPTPWIGSVSPSSWDNRSSITVTVSGGNFLLNDKVILKPACSTDPAVPADTCAQFDSLAVPANHEVGPITSTSNSADYCPAPGCGPEDKIKATFNLGQAAPGKYQVIVQHASPDNTPSNPYGYFTIFSYGPANASSSRTGVGATGTNVFLSDTCDVTNNGCGRDNGLTNGIPLDVLGANIAYGARVRFLLPNGGEDTGLEFQPGNPSNGANRLNSGFDNTAYPSSTALEGMYRHYDAASGNHAKFTPGVHLIQVVNTDGDTSGSKAVFVQPWFANAASVSRVGLGKGAQNVLLTVNGKGFRSGAFLTPDSTCGSSGGAGVLSNPQGDGTYNTISGRVNIKSSAPSGTCGLNVVNTDGGAFGLPVLTIGTPPHITAVSPGDTSYAHLGQGARVGCDGNAGSVLVTGTNFVDDNPLNANPKNPDLMTKFDFGPDITVTTLNVGATSAAVCIDVLPKAAVGRRDVTAINPDGGSTTTTQPVVCSDPVLQVDCQPDMTKADQPLQINEGPKITDVTPSSFQRGDAFRQVTVTGTGFHTSIADADVDISPTGFSHLSTQATATKVTFLASVAQDASTGLHTLTITNPDDYGRAVSSVSVDSLAVSPTSAGNSLSAVTLTLAVQSPGLPPITSASTVKLIHQTDLPGQPVIQATNVTAGADASHGSGVVDLTNAALGKYNVVVVLDPAATSPTTVSCAGCFTVTGNALTLDSAPVTPAKAGQGVVDWKLTFKGTGFTKGTQVNIPDVDTHGTTFVSPTEITVLASVAPNATTGAKTGTVTGGDGTSKTFAFTVTAAPTPKSISTGAAYGAGAGSAGSPDTSGTPAASTLPITVDSTGADADPDTQIVLGDRVDVTGENATEDTPPTCLPAVPPAPPVCSGGSNGHVDGLVAVGPTASQGKRGVTLVNPADGGTATLADAFTVNPGPVVSSVGNENGQAVLVRDGLKHTVSFFGSSFPTPTTDADKAAAFKITELSGAAIDPAAIKVENVQFTQSKITADVTVATTRAFGAVRVAVYNAVDKGFVACTTCVSVASVPGVVPNLVLTSGAKSLMATWSAAASNGAAITDYHLTIQPVGGGTVTPFDVPGSTLSYPFTGLVNGVSYVVRVQAINAAGVGGPASKTGIAGLPSALSIRVSPTAVTYGQAYYVTGKLTSNGVGIGGKTLILTFVPTIGASYTRTVTTIASGASTGVFSYRTSSPYTVRVKALLVPNDPTYRPVGTAYVLETVKVRILKSYPVNGSRSSYTSILKITGTVTPNKRGRYAYLSRVVNGRDVLLQRVTISYTSTFAFAIKPGRGTYTMHVYVPATPGNAANYSALFTLYRV